MNDTFPVIDGHTKLTGLLGSPVSHSISPLMHNEAFRPYQTEYLKKEEKCALFSK